ncbi:MAG: IS66 family transposase [Desulfatirhabdiaceae bacterium]
MTRDEAIAILELPREQAIEAILKLSEKAELFDPGPTTPSGMIPTYLKPKHGKKKNKPGRPIGHPGISRVTPAKIDQSIPHELCQCPDCGTPVKKPLRVYRRVIEDIPPIEPKVTEHVINGYWCPACKKIVSPKVTEALPNANIGLRLVVFTAWLHYLVGMSVNNLVAMLQVLSSVKISAGGLTQAWGALARYLWHNYEAIGNIAGKSAVLHADETGWRLNGITHWLWCFTNKSICYYMITQSRGSPVVKEVLGRLFGGILVCDFWGAYNKISTLATQRCFFHLFTELVKVDKKNRSQDWKCFRKKLSRLMKDAIRLSENKEIGTEKRDRLKARLNNRLDEMIVGQYEDKDVKRLIKRLKRHRNQMFTFLEYADVSPYNNHAEQQMRKAVMCRKISQQNRSEAGAVTQAVLMTLFRTAELQKKNPVENVLAAAKTAIEKGKPDVPEFKLAA